MIKLYVNEGRWVCRVIGTPRMACVYKCRVFEAQSGAKALALATRWNLLAHY